MNAAAATLLDLHQTALSITKAQKTALQALQARPHYLAMGGYRARGRASRITRAVAERLLAGGLARREGMQLVLTGTARFILSLEN